jgi:hypothetical protein
MSKFIPTRGQHYYMINSRFKIVLALNTGNKKSSDRITVGNAFKKHADAKRFLDGMLGLVKTTNKRWWEFWV